MKRADNIAERAALNDGLVILADLANAGFDVDGGLVKVLAGVPLFDWVVPTIRTRGCDPRGDLADALERMARAVRGE